MFKKIPHKVKTNVSPTWSNALHQSVEEVDGVQQVRSYVSRPEVPQNLEGLNADDYDLKAMLDSGANLQDTTCLGIVDSVSINDLADSIAE